MRHLPALTAALLLALSSLSVSADTVIQPSGKISYQELFSSNVCTSSCDQQYQSCLKSYSSSQMGWCQNIWKSCLKNCQIGS